jgi:hypothetical protein
MRHEVTPVRAIQKKRTGPNRDFRSPVDSVAKVVLLKVSKILRAAGAFFV